MEHRIRRGATLALLAAVSLGGAPRAGAQPSATPATDPDPVQSIRLATGRSRALAFDSAVTKVAVADTAVLDVVVVSDRDVVLNGKKTGETDVLLWSGRARHHYRVAVGAPDDRPQVVLSIKFAEVRRDALTALGVSLRAQSGAGRVGRVGTGALSTSQSGDPATGNPSTPASTGFFTILTDLGTRNVLAFLDAQEQRGTARTLAEPRLMAANREEASFLAGGEIPIPIAQPGAGGQPFITISFREFGVRLTFTPEVLSDSLVKLRVRPEVSSLDYSNALVLSGVRVPALRSRKLESTVDVRRDEGLIISGLIDDQRERVRTGVPGLMNLPLLGRLFSSERWQRNESELLIVVTPTIVDPNRPRASDVIRFAPDSTLPAREAIERRLPATPPAGRP